MNIGEILAAVGFNSQSIADYDSVIGREVVESYWLTGQNNEVVIQKEDCVLVCFKCKDGTQAYLLIEDYERWRDVRYRFLVFGRKEPANASGRGPLPKIVLRDRTKFEGLQDDRKEGTTHFGLHKP